MKPRKTDQEVNEQLEREMTRRARRKAQIERSGNAPTGTQPHKSKKHYNRKPKHKVSYAY